MATRAHEYLSNSSFWGWTLAAVALDRASSYGFRPPDEEHPGAHIEQLVPYWMWAVLLTISGLLIVVNSIDARRKLAGLAGHVISIFCYVTFGASIVADAVLHGAAWAGSGTILITAMLHFGRLLLIAGGRRE